MKYLINFIIASISPLIFSLSSIAQDGLDLEYQLVIIETGKFPSENDIMLSEFRRLLDSLSETFIENEQQIADMTVTSWQALIEKNIYVSMLQMMDGIDQIFSEKIENQQYAEYMAAYMTLRMDDQSHSEAILGLNAILEEFGVY